MRTAVILAARKDHDSDIPYPLKNFRHNESLLKRIIGILKECDYNRIIVVGGYRFELFKEILCDEVELIENTEYEFTSSMGSLALCRDYIHTDFLLVEGDTLFEKQIIEKMSDMDSGNCFSITEESGSGDECFVETKNGFIVKITKDRHRVCNFEGEMIGVTRIAYATFQKLLEAWDNSSNPYLNYEYLLMDVTDALDRPYVKFKNIIWGDIDCAGDFHKLENYTYRALQRKENPFDEENLRAHLKAIFPNEDTQSAVISPIGGMSNKNFKVDIDGKSYVLRVPGNGSTGMVDRDNEEYNANEASRLGVNPKIRYFDSVTGVKLSDFIEGAETLTAATIQRHDNMRKIAKIYQTVHNSHIRLKNDFNIFNEIKKYDALLESAGAEMYTGWQNVKPLVLRLESYLNSLGIDLRPCHNDALYENFIKSPDGTIFLIDWEYSGMNDPMADFAALFLEAGFTPENEDYILEMYFEGNIPAAARLKILCYQILWDYLWSQWTIIKEAAGDDFGSYGIDRFNRAKTNLKTVEHLI